MKQPTSASAALKAAKQLIGQWPHAKPDDPEIYIASLGAALGGYPFGVVQECCDPRTGLSRSREFAPTVAAVVEWCDKRQFYHEQWARYRPIRKTVPAERPESDFSPEHRKTMLQRLSALMHGLFDKPQAEAAE